MPIVERVLEVAEHHGVPMAQVALAWHWAKGVTVPISWAVRSQNAWMMPSPR
ncbi:hypothetical protein OB937_06305 [Bifidobacterium catenulatum subsp. kashiwanohense]|nr:hypothetical protein [Bifidobacterium catenulatum]MDH7882891.1 hypothetical protein [Bifidobacterium catenulatum subsp. kashiwanohense]